MVLGLAVAAFVADFGVRVLDSQVLRSVLADVLGHFNQFHPSRFFVNVIWKLIFTCQGVSFAVVAVVQLHMSKFDEMVILGPNDHCLY